MSIRIELPVGPNDHILGNAAAPVTLVEYGDFECNYCAMAFPILKQVLARFPDDLRFVFRHAPQTRQHPAAELAAEAAEAAGAQGKFWPFHDRLYSDRSPIQWDRLVAEAKALDLDVPRFVADVEGHQFRDIVTQLERSGTHTVRGTPTFFLDDLRYEEGSDFDSLVNAIEAIRRGR
jgi:protein-disulfide isomerase